MPQASPSPFIDLHARRILHEYRCFYIVLMYVYKYICLSFYIFLDMCTIITRISLTPTHTHTRISHLQTMCLCTYTCVQTCTYRICMRVYKHMCLFFTSMTIERAREIERAGERERAGAEVGGRAGAGEGERKGLGSRGRGEERERERERDGEAIA